MNDDQYEDLTNGATISTAKMAIGETFTGKLVALETSKQYPDKQNLIMETEDGGEVTLFVSGSLNYAIKDGKFEVGRTYRITRLENKLTKKGASRTQFQLQRLKDDGAVAAPVVNESRPASR